MQSNLETTVGDLVSSVRANPGDSRLRSESLNGARLSGDDLPPDAPVWEIWQRFAEMYGHRWSSQQGDEPNDTWIRGTYSLTTDQIARGLSQCVNLAQLWPPTLPEFRKLCVDDPGVPRWECRAHKVYDTSSLLEDQTARDARIEEGKKQIAALRAECGI